MGGFGVHLMSALLKFDHLLAEGKSLSAIYDEQLHAEDFRVKVNADVDVGDGEDEVVERIHGYGHIRRMILAPGSLSQYFAGAARVERSGWVSTPLAARDKQRGWLNT